MRLGSARRRRDHLRDQSPSADDRAWARATPLRPTIGPARPATDTPGFLRTVAGTHAVKLSVEPPRMRSLADRDRTGRPADGTIDRLLAQAMPASPSLPPRQMAQETPA